MRDPDDFADRLRAILEAKQADGKPVRQPRPDLKRAEREADAEVEATPASYFRRYDDTYIIYRYPVGEREHGFAFVTDYDETHRAYARPMPKAWYDPLAFEGASFKVRYCTASPDDHLVIDPRFVQINNRAIPLGSRAIGTPESRWAAYVEAYNRNVAAYNLADAETADLVLARHFAEAAVSGARAHALTSDGRYRSGTANYLSALNNLGRFEESAAAALQSFQRFPSWHTNTFHNGLNAALRGNTEVTQRHKADLAAGRALLDALSLGRFTDWRGVLAAAFEPSQVWGWLLTNLALFYEWTGDHESAIGALSKLATFNPQALIEPELRTNFDGVPDFADLVARTRNP